jgi:hypothetical protein
MTREANPLVLTDVAAFARALGRSLEVRHATRPEPPGHVELLNLIARAAASAAGKRCAQQRSCRRPQPPSKTLPQPPR